MRARGGRTAFPLGKAREGRGDKTKAEKDTEKVLKRLFKEKHI